MLTYECDAICCHEHLFSDWKRVKVVFAAASQCNRDISCCMTVDWHFEPQIVAGRKEIVFKPCFLCWKFGLKNKKKVFNYSDFYNSLNSIIGFQTAISNQT